MIEEHDLVAHVSDIPDEGLASGDIGTVVSVHKQGQAYTVEFMTIGGRTVAVTLVRADKLRPVSQDEMQQARPLVTAS
jgi:hypothetical protein